MSTKLVRISEEDHKRLRERKLVESESFGSVVHRLLDATEDDVPVGTDG